jgi:hypothetical protein
MTYAIARYSRVFPVLALAVLSACGGGGGSNVATDDIDRYLGTWTGCISYTTTSGESYFTNEVQTLAKVNATAANLQRTLLNKYTDQECKILSSAYYRQYNSTITLLSPFALRGLNGHRIIEASGTYSETQYIAVDETGMQFRWGAGDVSAAPPTGWSFPYTKKQ